MLGPSVLYASAPFALLRGWSARTSRPGRGLALLSLALSALATLLVLALTGLGVVELFLS